GECIAACERDRAAAHAAGLGIPGGADARQVDELRREHVLAQEHGVRLLPYALRGIRRTDPVREPHHDRVSGDVSFPRWEADSAAIHLFTLFSGAPIQRVTRAVLWRELLGCPCHRIPPAK